jgi:hypothetical protein
MAEYIKFRLTAAKVGVTMAFLALLAGLTDRAQAAAPPPPPANFLRETSTGGVNRIVIQKLDSALATLEHKLATNFTTTHKLNQTFLKIKSANTSFLKIKSANSSFLKIKSANTDFLKIDDANANFLKIDDANASFLKIDDANSEFLKVGGTATNASELGGLSPSSFVQGGGAVITNAISSLAVSNTPATLLTVPGAVVLSVANTVGAGIQIDIRNLTGQTLASVVDNGNGTTSEHDLNPPSQVNPFGTTSFPFPTTGSPPVGQVHIQIFPNPALSEAVTMVVSTESSTTTLPSFVGQAFSGAA